MNWDNPCIGFDRAKVSHMHAILGTGISGIAYSTQSPEAVFFDKARFPGGRISTKPLGDSCYCDLGSTFFRSSPLEILKNGKKLFFSMESWMESQNIHYSRVEVEKNHILSHPIGGMHAIPHKLLKNKTCHFSKELVSFIILPNNNFLLRFLDGSEWEVEKLTITAPLPQALNFFPEGEEKKIWKEFTDPFHDYRQTLVVCGYWKEIPTSLQKSLKKANLFSFLDKSGDAEYISLESRKHDKDDSSLAFMIQYSAKFSMDHFDVWRNPDRSPTEFCRNQFEKDLHEFGEKFQLPFQDLPEPNEWRVHKWRYAQAESSLLGKNGILDLDNRDYRKYLEIVKDTRIHLVGDWVYGPRLERILGGILTEDAHYV